MVDAPALPQPGDTIAGKYLIERVIGRGGMSIVFGAHHAVTQKRFAIKWQLPAHHERALGSTPSAEATARFIREAQVAGRFQHPNVAVVYDVGAVAGAHYMVMDWLEGESLEELLEREHKLPLQDALRILIPCMRGVDEAHAQGIIHRDLKPGNIFLCRATKHEPETPKVLDFGIAKFTGGEIAVDGHITKMGALLGTPYYLSPEQVSSRPVDKRIDVYAFGVILYQVLCGRVPFSGASLGELLLQISAGECTALREIAPEVPPAIEQVVARAMARDPEQRFQELGELIAALSQAERAIAAHHDRAEASASLHVPTLPVASAAEPAAAAGVASRELPLLRTTDRQPRRRLRVFLYGAALLALLGLGIGAWQYSTAAGLTHSESRAADRTTVVQSSVRDEARLPEAGQPVSTAIAGAGPEARVAAEPAVQLDDKVRGAASLATPEPPAPVPEAKTLEIQGRSRATPARRGARRPAVPAQPTADPATLTPRAAAAGAPAVPAKTPHNPLRMRLQ